MSVNVQPTSNTFLKPRSLGAAILERRNELGLTQAALAERVAAYGDWGFRQSDISRLERGIVTLPHFTRLRSLAAALELPVGELLARSGWTGAERAFGPGGSTQVEQGSNGPEYTSSKQEHSAPTLLGSSEEIHQLRQEIVRLRETVSMLQETLASNTPSFNAGAEERIA